MDDHSRLPLGFRDHIQCLRCKGTGKVDKNEAMRLIVWLMPVEIIDCPFCHGKGKIRTVFRSQWTRAK